MKCLHICNDFLGSKVYTKLYEQLDERGVVQYVFSSLRAQNKKNIKKSQFRTPGSQIYYSEVLKNYHRFFFRFKVKFLYKRLNQIIDPSIEVVHATTMYSDGALALKIYKQYGIPYIVTIRATDIGAFNTYRPDLFFIGLEILKNASQIIFISHALKKTFYNHYFYKNFKKELLFKSIVITNGIDQFWIDNSVCKKTTTPLKILYVGTFLKRKNVEKLIETVLLLKKRFPKIELHIVGEGGTHENQIKQLSNQNFDTIKFLGAIKDKKDLLQEYRSNHIFAMTSVNETFGLVYLEALSQGLPILHSNNDGIDGAFSYNVGEGVNPKSLDSIAKGMEKILTNYSTYELNRIDFSDFSWKSKSEIYLNLYTLMLKSK